MVPCFMHSFGIILFLGDDKVIDMHYDLLHVLYQCYLRDDYTYVEDWIKSYNTHNVSGVIANLYFMNTEEMREEFGDIEINVLEMFKIATDLFKKYLPNVKVVFSIEGCDYIKDENELEELYKLGLRNILLVWNNPNKYGSGNRSHNGLSEAGKSFLIKAIDLGICIDMSHMNRETFNDTIELLREQVRLNKKVKVIASHSNSFELCDHLRNLTDEQLRKLKEFDPIVGVVSYSRFVSNTGNYKEMYLKHILHMINILGVDHVGVSSDNMEFYTYFCDGYAGEKIFEYSSIRRELEELLSELKEEDREKILYKNVYNKLFLEV